MKHATQNISFVLIMAFICLLPKCANAFEFNAYGGIWTDHLNPQCPDEGLYDVEDGCNEMNQLWMVSAVFDDFTINKHYTLELFYGEFFNSYFDHTSFHGARLYVGDRDLNLGWAVSGFKGYDKEDCPKTISGRDGYCYAPALVGEYQGVRVTYLMSNVVQVSGKLLTF